MKDDPEATKADLIRHLEGVHKVRQGYIIEKHWTKAALIELHRGTHAKEASA